MRNCGGRGRCFGHGGRRPDPVVPPIARVDLFEVERRASAASWFLRSLRGFGAEQAPLRIIRSTIACSSTLSYVRSTVQESKVQESKVQESTVKESTVQESTGSRCPSAR